MSRTATVQRKTGETDITVTIDLDGTGKAQIATGIGFFDHMLDAFARHGLFDLTVQAAGDLKVDGHHTVEDVGIVLGGAIAKALGDKKGIRRFGDCILPMDESLAMAAVDLSGRPYFVMDAQFGTQSVGDFDTELVQEFFYSLSYASMMNLHLRLLAGNNAHHMIEAMFKAFAKSLDQATTIDPRVQGVPSTKGSL
ncbi:MAG: imidazoleglycerol-phosphate dehydratase HisB [Lachnospiraceae bacterium]|nr:imidazoleglycerol-phosphate dehydratase HisB [Lachnospiraceae bacterium]